MVGDLLGFLMELIGELICVGYVGFEVVELCLIGLCVFGVGSLGCLSWTGCWMVLFFGVIWFVFGWELFIWVGVWWLLL